MLKYLTATIKGWSTKGAETILMWDANSSLADLDQALVKFQVDTGLTSLLSNPLHLPKSYDRGQQCIDFIMGTPKAKAATTRSGMLAFYEGVFHFDHRALFVDIDSKILIGEATAEDVSRGHRNLKSTVKKDVQTFLESLEEQDHIDSLLLKLQEISTLSVWTDHQHSVLEVIAIGASRRLL
jgi:hypothetical protein